MSGLESEEVGRQLKVLNNRIYHTFLDCGET